MNEIEDHYHDHPVIEFTCQANKTVFLIPNSTSMKIHVYVPVNLFKLEFNCTAYYRLP